MRFQVPGAGRLGLAQASALGYAPGGRLLHPAGDADLRQALYSPDASFREVAASVLCSLFPEDLDPLAAGRLAERAFPEEPAFRLRGDGILMADLASGPGYGAADNGAGLLAALAAPLRGGEGGLFLAASGPGGRDAAALAEALAGSPGSTLVVLHGGGPLRGIRRQRLAREGGNLLVVETTTPGHAASLLSAAAGGSLLGQRVTLAGPGNPARLAARIVLHAAIFTSLRHDFAGDLFSALPEEDRLGIASGLWAWRLGLPLTGILAAADERSGEKAAGQEGEELVQAFEEGRPGLLRSLVLRQDADRDQAGAAAAAWLAETGQDMDGRSARSLAAAERALAGGMAGHARVVVWRGGRAFWDDESVPAPEGCLADARADAELGPGTGLAGLESLLAGLPFPGRR